MFVGNQVSIIYKYIYIYTYSENEMHSYKLATNAATNL